MSLTNKLRTQTDLPVWEWMRFAPTATTAISSMGASGGLAGRYLYYVVGLLLYRYDTISDNWQQLAALVTTPVAPLDLTYSSQHGFPGRVLAATSTTFTGALLVGQALKGYQVRIIAGTGAGQTRTITNVADPVVADTMVCSSGSTGSITDSNKAWAWNQYAGYQVRIYAGTGAGQVRTVLYTNGQTLTVSDVNWSAQSPYQWGALFVTAPVATAGTQSLAFIESSVATIDSPWTVTPDTTSVFMVLSGTIFLAAATANPYSLLAYDVASDVWYNKTSTTNLTPATWTVDLALERLGELNATYVSRTATSGSSTTLTDSGLALTANRYAWQRLRITGGTGAGQERTISSHTATVLTVTPPFTTTPDATSTYEIVADWDQLYMLGNGSAAMYQYSCDWDLWAAGHIYDLGVCNQGAVVRSGYLPLGITSITRVTTTATVTTAISHPYKVGDSITIVGATGADASLYNITTTVTAVASSTTFTYTMIGSPTGSAVFTAPSTTTLIDPTKAWVTNEHVGRVLMITAPGPVGVGQFRRITANTATTLTFAVATAPVTGLSRYAITAAVSFGTVPGGSGVATGGSTTTLIDTTQAWTTNQFAGLRLKFTAGTGIAQEVIISSNTNNTLTFPVATAPDTTTQYSILQLNPRGAGTGLHWNGGVTDLTVRGKYLYSFRGGATAGLDRYNLATDAWEYLAYFPQTETFTTGSMYIYDGADRIYFTKDATGRVYYYDLALNIVQLAGQVPYGMGGAITGCRMEVIQTTDGLKYLYVMRHTGAEMWRTLLFF